MADAGGVLYCDPHFFDAAFCRRVIRAMNEGVAEDAEVLDFRMEQRDEIRRAASVDVAPAVIRQVESALDRRRDVLAKFFGIALAEREGAGLLRYRAGGFYAPHVDRVVVGSWPAAARRAVALVTFLNGSREVEPDGEFTGGVLRLFTGVDVIEVPPRRGQLVAFRADVLHEVTEVCDGTRDAVVDWFYSGAP